MADPRLIEAERAKRLRHRNWAVLAVLLGFVVLVYVVSIVKMKGG
jgi:hypothetical protein